MFALAAAFSPPTLIGLTILAVAVLVILTVQYKLQPFIAMVVVSIVLGLVAGMPPGEVAKSFQDGVGAVLGSITMVIALGTVLGKMLAQSGGAEVIARRIVAATGDSGLHFAMCVIAFLVGLPVFFAVGIVLLTPILFSTAAKSGKPLLFLGLPVLAGLATVHTMVPPHPGVMAAIGLIKADVGRTLLYGLLVGGPAALISGPAFGRWLGRRSKCVSGIGPLKGVEPAGETVHSPPSFGIALVTILLPVAFMLFSTIAELIVPKQSPLLPWARFFGNATVALAIAVLVSFYTFGKARGLDGKGILKLADESLGPIATVLLIVGAGGGFSRVLVNSGVGDVVTGITRDLALPPLALGWSIAAALRVATGSSTVGVTAAAGIIAPLVSNDRAINPELMVLALGAGSLFLSHVNDGGFWLVKELYGLTVPETLRTWTVLTTVLSVLLLGLVLLLDVFI